MTALIVRVAACALLLPTAALAQAIPQGTAPTPAAVRVDATPPDGPQPYGDYTLFNPTPDDKLRTFSPDRPNKGTGPVTVDAGHFQIETDLFGALYDATPSTRTRSFYTADPVIKLGLTDHWDVEVSLGGYQDLHVKDRSTGLTSRSSGFGDIMLRTKVNVWGANGGDTALAIVPFVKLPTAADGLGNNQVEGGVSVPYTYSLPWNVTALVMTELDVFKNANDAGKHAGFTNLINLSRPLTDALSANIEFWSQVQTAHTPTQFTLDLALAYTLGANTQFDAGTYIGLNKAAPDVVGYLGLSRRF